MSTTPYSLNIGAVNERMLVDRTWITANFLLPVDLMKGNDETIKLLMRYSTVMGTVWDTTVGGHLALNCPPQNNPLADIRGGLLNGSDVHKGDYSTGMGRFFHEGIERNMETVTFQPGHMRHQGIVPFFTRFYDAEQGMLAKTGHGPGIFFRAGQVAGTAATIAAMFLSTPLAVVILTGAVSRFFLSRPSSGYWYIKPSPWAYWRRCQFIINQLQVYLKLTPLRGQYGNGLFAEGQMDESQKGDTKEFLRYAEAMAPNIFKDGRFDIMYVGLRGARLDYLRREKLGQHLLSINKDNMVNSVREMIKARFEDVHATSVEEYTELYFRSHYGNEEYRQFDPMDAMAQDRANNGTVPGSPKPDTETDTAIASESNALGDSINATLNKAGELPSRMRAQWKKDETGSAVGGDGTGTGGDNYSVTSSWADDVAEFAINTAKKGADFVTFKVDSGGTVSESFSSSLGEPEIASKINSASSSAASARFSFSGGTTGIDTVDAVMGAVGDFLKGTLSGVNMDGLLALAGSAHVNIPKHYQESSANFQSHSFNIELRSPYGDRLSQFLNLYVPLACLLALALPLGTGPQSYTAPFYVMCYSKGRCLARNAMVSSLSVTRGTGNQGWNQRLEPLAIDVQLEVTDCAQVMYAPIDPGLNLTRPWAIAFDDDSAFKDYLTTLASMSLVDMTDPVRKIGINLAKFQLEWGTMFSATNMGMWAGDGTIQRLLAQGARVISGQPSELQLNQTVSPTQVMRGLRE